MAQTAEPTFTRTERRMLAVLADGLPHAPRELHACLADDLGPTRNIRYHLSRIRAKIRPLGQDILCVIHNRKAHYRHVQTLRPQLPAT